MNTTKSIRDFFARAYVINLPERTDRRREFQAMLDNIGLGDGSNWLNYYSAIRPDSASDFPSIGARGCFLSHLEVLRSARDDGLKNVLIMEDDLMIHQQFIDRFQEIQKKLIENDWCMAYFGHVLSHQVGNSDCILNMTDLPIATTHFYAVNGTHVDRIIGFLEKILSRPAGHPEGGPMHVDGAYSTFRNQNPNELTYVAFPVLGTQRSSCSDVTTNWIDRTFGLKHLARFLRRIKNANNSGR